MFFLVHYNRPTATLQSLTSYSRFECASQDALALEISLLGKNDGEEIVVFEASSELDLRQSHSRYFTSLEDFRLPAR